MYPLVSELLLALQNADISCELEKLEKEHVIKIASNVIGENVIFSFFV